jgi:hypothetical protein
MGVKPGLKDCLALFKQARPVCKSKQKYITCILLAISLLVIQGESFCMFSSFLGGILKS